jgi:hypothetical protein
VKGKLQGIWRGVSLALFSGWLGLVLALGGLGMGRFISLAGRELDPPDFGTYLLASRLLEASPADLYDTAALTSLVSDEGPRQAYVYIYPPFVAGALRPLASLPYRQAVTAWLVLNGLCLVSAVVVLLILTGWPGGQVGALLALALLLLFTPAQEAILLGQVSPILLLLGVLALLLIDRSQGATHDFAGGILLGVATLIKVFPALLLVHSLLRGRWRVVLGGALGGAACIVAGVFLGGGWANTWTYFSEVLPSRYSGSFVFVHLGNQSLTASFLRPMGDQPLVRTLGLGAALAVFVVTWLVPFFRRRTHFVREFALISMLPLLALSAVYSHLYVLILLPAAVLVQSWMEGERRLLGPLLLSYLLLIVNSYSEWIGLRVATWVPFGLVGTLILWGALLHQVGRGHHDVPAIPRESEP